MAGKYTTIQGDTWDCIAKKTLGNEYLMTDLIDANPLYQNVVIFSANITLQVPVVDAAQSQNATNLPPWNRGVGT